MTRWLFLLLLCAGAASAATLRDNVKDPASIQDVFPKTARLRVVNVWATWCVPCVAETGLSNALDELLGGKTVSNQTTRAFGCTIKWQS